MQGTLSQRVWDRLERAAREERGDVIIQWAIMGLGLAIAAAGIIAVVKPAVLNSAGRIVGLLGQ